ncbi:MAG TPA: trypsin-like peptidase domain-containing protein [Acidimicrobiales bacterium]|nr:trypsin-like peptidase domain-containing protein [Acidimicrobiales bacterium]
MSGPPEEPENGDPGRDEGGADPDEPESPLRGWIDPDDRLWRHPSEQVPAVQAAGPVLSPPAKHRSRGILMVIIAAGAVAAVGAFLVVLLSPASESPLKGSGRNARGGATLTTLTDHMNGVPAAAQTAAKSMVELHATTNHGTVTLIGVAVAEGGMVVTTANLLTGVEHIDMVGPGGKLEQASVVGTDATSNVALVNVPADVPVAPFSDDGALGGGAPDTVLNYAPSGGSAVALVGTAGTLSAVATASTSAACPDSGMAALTSSPGLASQTAGEPLLDASGAVIGILCQPAPGSATVTFLPTQLVVGVADALRSGNRVAPGVLGVEGTDVANGAGAKLMTVPSGTPAWGRLQAGEVITAVNQLPVRTFAELRARLYVLQPGTPVSITVFGAPGTSGAKSVGVTLGKSS